jgi:hypothetical protein
MVSLKRNKPANLICSYNSDYEITWDSDETVFLVEYDKRMQSVVELNTHIDEILVYSPKFDFGCAYVSRQEDFDYINTDWT